MNSDDPTSSASKGPSDLGATRPIDPDATTNDRRASAPDPSSVSRAPLGTWGPLELIEKIGEGAFGETFRARDPWLDREVALKLLKPGTGSATGVGARVIREGVLLARVSHPQHADAVRVLSENSTEDLAVTRPGDGSS